MPIEAAVARSLGRIKIIAYVGLLIALLAAILATFAMLDDGSESGPSGKVVRFKNVTGANVAPGMLVQMSSSEDGLPAGDRRAFGPAFEGIPPNNNPGTFNSGGGPGSPDDPGYRAMNYTPPPHSMSWVFTFELDDGTRFQGVACSPTGAGSGTHVHEVEAVLKSREEDDKTFYWLEFQLAYAVELLGGTWVYHKPDTDEVSEEVEAGMCLGPDCPIEVPVTPPGPGGG